MKVLFLIFIAINLICCEQHQNQRIIGGETVNAGQYTFLAAIYKTTSDGSYFCTGSLVSRRWILTAGQCVKDAVLFTIYLGTTNIKDLASTALKLATDEYVLHPEFNPETFENDLGLIKLQMDIQYNSFILYIPLPSSDVEPNNEELRAIGWGQTSDVDGALADQLQWVGLTSISNDECKISYGNIITDRMLCVVGNYNEGTCHGDTGGPLISLFGGQSYAPIHQGIASFLSANGCESIDPSGFTRTYPYLDWIRNITNY